MRSKLPDAVGGVLWFGLDDANMTVFTPVYCQTDKVPVPYRQGNGDCVTFSWDSGFWIYNWVAGMVRPRYSLMEGDMRAVQNTLEDTFADAQKGHRKHGPRAMAAGPEEGPRVSLRLHLDDGADGRRQLEKAGRVPHRALQRRGGEAHEGRADTASGHGNTAPLDRPGYSEDFLRQLVKETGDRYRVKALK